MPSAEQDSPADHYFSESPEVTSVPRHVEVPVAGRKLRLLASSGVFSADRLDPGTTVLLRKAPLPTGGGTFLDLGAGYGPIACALASSAPSATVYAVDVNRRALDLLRNNAESLGLADRLIAAVPDDVPNDIGFDQIWSNPPIRIGKPALHQLLDRWLPDSSRTAWHGWWSRATSVVTRCRPGWPVRAGGSTGRPVRRGTGCFGWYDQVEPAAL